MDDEPGSLEPMTEEARIQTFLIADVRGYTLFTQQRGDEAAAKLAAKFARIARETVQQRGGSVIELRGDEALAVFSSARQAVAAAIDLQERLVDEKGEVRRFVNVYVNEEDIRFLQNQQTKLKDGDEISIIPAIAGG